MDSKCSLSHAQASATYPYPGQISPMQSFPLSLSEDSF